MRTRKSGTTVALVTSCQVGPVAYPNKTMARDSKKSGGPRTICTSARVVCNHHIGRARSSNESASSAVSPSGSCKGPARSPIPAAFIGDLASIALAQRKSRGPSTFFTRLAWFVISPRGRTRSSSQGAHPAVSPQLPDCGTESARPEGILRPASHPSPRQ